MYICCSTAGTGARKMQRWWPREKPDQQGFAWTEIAVRLLSPDGPDAAQRVRMTYPATALLTGVGHSPAAVTGHKEMMAFLNRALGELFVQLSCYDLTCPAGLCCVQVAEMVQHLEICPVLAVACSAYAQKPQLLQVSLTQQC
jgi:hypothetical protein